MTVAESFEVTIDETFTLLKCERCGAWMDHVGGKNAGCAIKGGCNCSVPVYQCHPCQIVDYGDNAEAKAIMEVCARKWQIVDPAEAW